MINHWLVQKALRTKLLALEVCTTGSVQISATATGYARASGSFITDGFLPGMEVAGAGFSESANNTAKTITGVSALTITCPGCTVEAAGARTLTVGLPADRAWENVKLKPTQGDPYVEETYLPGPMEVITLGATAEMEILPNYVLRVFVPEGYDAGAARAYADALLEHFAPRTPITVTDASVSVRTDVAPFEGQLLQTDTGHAVVPVTVPLRIRTANSI